MVLKPPIFVRHEAPVEQKFASGPPARKTLSEHKVLVDRFATAWRTTTVPDVLKMKRRVYKTRRAICFASLAVGPLRYSTNVLK